MTVFSSLRLLLVSCNVAVLRTSLLSGDSVCYTELIVEDLPHIATIWTLWQRVHSTISFDYSRHSAHCLNHLYTAKLKLLGAMRLRARGHDFEVPTVKFEFSKRNFIVHSLFQYV